MKMLKESAKKIKYQLTHKLVEKLGNSLSEN